MNLQLVDLVNQYKKIKNEINAAIQAVLDSGQFILGKSVQDFENNAAKYLGVKHAIGCASGTDALQIALMALGIGKDDEVITTSFTFVATVETIVLMGAKPVYVDIEPETFNIDPQKIEAAITEKTKAIIPVHLYGHPVEMDPIIKIAKKYNLYLIEDSAQAMGAEYKGKKVSTLGDVGCISFFPSKNLGAYGDAGMVTTNNDELAEKIRMIIVHGSKIRYYHELLGINSRLDSIQAAVLNVKLNYLDQWNETRRKAAQIYNELLNKNKIGIPIVKEYAKHIFHQYTIKVKNRDKLSDFLKSKNIPHAIYYPIPLHRQNAYKYLVPENLSLPETEKAADEVISLPMHTELTFEMQKYIADNINSFFE